jgi:hypothetical protein
MHEGWMALCISILRGCNPDTAFKALEKGVIRYNADDIKEMYHLKHSQNFTYKQIGEIFGMHKGAVYKTMKRHREWVES